MTELGLSIGEPFTSPAWGSNFVVFSGDEVIEEDSSKEYMRKVCKYARNFGVHVVPQRFYMMGYQCLCLVAPDGRVVGAQKGIYCNNALRVSKHSASLEVLTTEFGGILLCVDVDIYHPEVFRIAEGMGAQYIICSQYVDLNDYNSSMVITGAWNAAQSSNAYVIDTCNAFHCVAAPIALTKHSDGFVAPPTMRMPVTAKLNADDLQKCTQPFRLSRQFYAVHRNDLLR